MEKEKIIFQKNVCRPRVKNPNIEEQAKKKKKKKERQKHYSS